MRSKIFAGIAMLALVIQMAVVGEAAQDESLVLCLTFDGEKVKDLSGNGNDGVIKGAPKFVDGKYGSGLELEAPDDYIEVPDSDSLHVEEVTAMVWVNLPVVGGDQKIMGKTGSSPTKGFVLGVQAAKIYPECWDSAGGISFSKGNPVVPTNTWTHLAMTYSIEDEVLLSYIDGKEEKRADTNGQPLGVDTNVLRIGHAPWNIGDPYAVTGIIDEVRVYNRALSAEEISEAMEEYKAVVAPTGNLISVWGRIKAWY